MVHSADSRIQGHAFRCPLFSPAVRDHASTNPASFSPWARPQAQRCSTTKALPNHRASGWTCSSIHCLPREVRGQNKKTVPSLRTRTSGVLGTSCDELLMDACSFWSNTHQVTKTEKAPSYQAQSWRPFALCATSAFRLTTVRLHVIILLRATATSPVESVNAAGLSHFDVSCTGPALTRRDSSARPTDTHAKFCTGICTAVVDPVRMATLARGVILLKAQRGPAI